MNGIRPAILVCMVLLTGCSLLNREEPAAEEPAAKHAALRGTATWKAPESLATLTPPPNGAELIDFQRYWCSRDSASRADRRHGLDEASDSLEILLLDYCDQVRTHPQRIMAKLQAVEEERHWPREYRRYFAWLRWHVDAFNAAAAEANAQRRRMERTIDQLRAIESDLNSRDQLPEAPP